VGVGVADLLFFFFYILWCKDVCVFCVSEATDVAAAEALAAKRRYTYLCISMHMYLSIYLPLHLPIHLPIHPHIILSTNLYFGLTPGSGLTRGLNRC